MTSRRERAGRTETLSRAALVVGWLACAVAVPTVIAQARRVVDVVKVGDARSEREHEYAGDAVTEGVSDGKAFRQARGWLRYSLTVYDDTEVTVACTFVRSPGQRLPVDQHVEGRPIVTHTWLTPAATPAIVEFRIPMAVTRGKTVISVMLRAVDGPTPGLIEMRSVQEHLELPRPAGPAIPGTSGPSSLRVLRGIPGP
jgi:hypothetical protein